MLKLFKFRFRTLPIYSFTNFLLLYCAFVITAFAQNQPAAPQSKDLAISRGRIHVGNGSVIESGLILVSKGKITYCGADLSKNSSESIQIDASGMDIYPGLIACNTSVGLNEIEQVKATRDASELGMMNANVRSIIAYNTDSKIQATLRSNGVLIAEVVPEGGRISGQSSVVQLDAWNWEDAAIRQDDAIHLRWPNISRKLTAGENPSTPKQDPYKVQRDELDDFFNAAKAYSQEVTHNEINLRYEAMSGLWNSSKKLFVHVSEAQAMQDAVVWAANHGITPILVGAEDAYLLLDLLKAYHISIVLTGTHKMPMREDEDIDLAFKMPKILNDAGIPFCLSVPGFWQVRNLAFQAGQSIAFGLTHEEALRMVSFNAAQILGIADQVGTLEQGKDATLFISQGDALDIRTQNVKYAFIQGRNLDLFDHQKKLYQIYKEKYKQ